MRWASWEPIYRSIVSDMGYDVDEDHRAAVLLSSLEPDRGWATTDILRGRISRSVVIIGNSPSLEAELSNGLPKGTVVAAGSSIAAVVRAGIVPDVHVTDLDGDRTSHIEANARGCLTMAHAHGDNMGLIGDVVPALGGDILPTTQGRPFGHLVNMGGLTDGDRAFCMATEMGASDIHLIGFDLDRPRCGGDTPKATKARKLAWARRIIDEDIGMTGVRVHAIGVETHIPYRQLKLDI